MVILRNKEDWRVYPEELARRSRDSVRVVRTCLEELERVGYVRTYRKSLGRGKGIQVFLAAGITYLGAGQTDIHAAVEGLCEQIQ